MNHLATNQELCAALGVDPARVRAISIILLPNELPLARVERYVTGDFLQAVVDRYLLVRQEVFGELLALAKRHASECSECGGTGLIADCALCDCADIRAVIARAEGRV